jgi:hypothetical protein
MFCLQALRCRKRNRDEALVTTNYGLQAMVDELRCRCRFGMVAGEEDEWALDAHGCPAVLPLADLAAHEAACGFELVVCPHASLQARCAA